VILIMAIGGAGYIAMRTMGARYGLPIVGLASSFVSSTATIGAMGARVARSRAVLAAALAGAVLSTVATIIEMAIVLAATSLTTLERLSIPVICAGLAAVVYGAIFTILALQQRNPRPRATGSSPSNTDCSVRTLACGIASGVGKFLHNSHHARCEPIGRTSLRRHLPYWHTAVELTVYHWIRIHSRIASSVCALVSLPWHCETSAELAASVIPSGVVR